MNGKIMAKMEDKEFAKKALVCKNEQEITELFAREGMEVACEDLRDLCALINEITAETKELSENDLDHVSGGVAAGAMREGREEITALIKNMAVGGQLTSAVKWWDPQVGGNFNPIVCAYGIRPPSFPIKDWPKQPEEPEELK